VTAPVIDAHVRLGRCRDAPELTEAALLAAMDEHGVDRTLVAPAEHEIVLHHRAGNARIADVCARHPSRLSAYAVASPWDGDEAIAILREARAAGAVALAVDPVLQGFDPLDGLLDPLLRFCAEAGWFAYVRTGTPPTALPLPVAELALAHPDVPIVMGRSGFPDFVIDAAHALRRAPNLYADVSYSAWDGLIGTLADDPAIGPERLVFSSDAPYALIAQELARLRSWPVPPDVLDRVTGGTVAALLALRGP
jgi:predicted TIM-barrel fold metal-dependent hydrolase